MKYLLRCLLSYGSQELLTRTPEHLLLLTHLLLPSLCCFPLLIPFRQDRSLHCPWGQALAFLELSLGFAWECSQCPMPPVSLAGVRMAQAMGGSRNV